MHTHIIPPAVIAAGEKRLFGMHAEAKTLHICAHGVPMHPLSKVDALVERIKSDGLDGAIVSVPPPPYFGWTSVRTDRTSYTRLVNDSLLAACRSHDSMIRPFAYLPIEDPELAADVASRLDTNWAGAVAGTDLGLLSYASERYDALWQTLSDAKLPLFIHPGSSPDTRLDPFYLSNLLGNPLETTIAAANLIFAGVMHRFPGLKVILAHGGGCVAALCGRWQQGSATEPTDIPKLALQPLKPYAASMSTVWYIRQVIFRRSLIPSDRIGFFSAATGRFRWAPLAEHDLAGLDVNLKRRIRKTNAEHVFGSRLFTHASSGASTKDIL